MGACCGPAHSVGPTPVVVGDEANQPAVEDKAREESKSMCSDSKLVKFDPAAAIQQGVTAKQVIQDGILLELTEKDGQDTWLTDSDDTTTLVERGLLLNWFASFANKEYAAENLTFAMEIYRLSKVYPDLKTLDLKKKMLAMAYATFLAPGAEHEVCLSPKYKNLVTKAFGVDKMRKLSYAKLTLLPGIEENRKSRRDIGVKESTLKKFKSCSERMEKRGLYSEDTCSEMLKALKKVYRFVLGEISTDSWPRFKNAVLDGTFPRDGETIKARKISNGLLLTRIYEAEQQQSEQEQSTNWSDEQSSTWEECTVSVKAAIKNGENK